MEKIRVLVAEDEPLARAHMTRLLRERMDFEVVAECSNGRDALEGIRRHAPELVLIDVEMPEMNGLEVIDALEPSGAPAVIFVTAYDQYAVRAFDMHALDYLLKPFDEERFDRALHRAKDRIRRGQIEGLSRQLMALLQDLRGEGVVADEPRGTGEQRYLERLAVKSAGRVSLLRVQEIDWIEGAGVYARIHVGKKSHLLRESLNNLEQKLDPACFVRIHRSSIVNVERVRELVSHLHGEYIVVLSDGTQLKLSRKYRDKLQEILGG